MYKIAVHDFEEKKKKKKHSKIMKYHCCFRIAFFPTETDSIK